MDNSGITTPCPNCKYILFQAGNFIESGSFKMKCSSCKKKVIIKIIKKVLVETAIVALIILAVNLIFNKKLQQIVIGVFVD